MKKRPLRIHVASLIGLSAGGFGLGVLAWVGFLTMQFQARLLELAVLTAVVSAVAFVYAFIVGLFSRALIPVVVGALTLPFFAYAIFISPSAEAMTAWLVGAGTVYVCGLVGGNTGQKRRVSGKQ